MSEFLNVVVGDDRILNLWQAIMEVGEVIQFYDSDRRFPAWGFGARTSDGTVSHCFNLSQSPTQYEVFIIPYLVSFLLLFSL